MYDTVYDITRAIDHPPILTFSAALLGASGTEALISEIPHEP